MGTEMYPDQKPGKISRLICVEHTQIESWAEFCLWTHDIHPCPYDSAAIFLSPLYRKRKVLFTSKIIKQVDFMHLLVCL